MPTARQSKAAAHVRAIAFVMSRLLSPWRGSFVTRARDAERGLLARGCGRESGGAFAGARNSLSRNRVGRRRRGTWGSGLVPLSARAHGGLEDRSGFGGRRG